ncbi:hypothetical protein [Winogradskyella vincentii]|uniref:GLPGLI family protein n=1 Tax=Winogradskyella vincentii TaxID=2877122 RepID=A0ABS7Y170_9FLAO|nr:hypothetical protein [Winogradskyella vincentii]MCA0153678.1 hypothetical protein [Winogradskyella vincentii]
MKRFVLSLCLVSCFLSQSQIKYEFDYALEYDYFQEQESTRNHKVTYYTNSKTNDYFMAVREIDSNNYRVYVRDNKLFTIIIQMPKDDFNKAYVINNNCEGVTKWDGKRYKKSAERYVFKSIKDTLLNKKQLSQYKIETLRKGRGVKDKSAYSYYILDETIEHQMPFFEPPLNYELWVRDKPFLNGIIDEYGAFDKRHGLRKYKLVNVKKVKKVFQIPDNCEQLN